MSTSPTPPRPEPGKRLLLGALLLLLVLPPLQAKFQWFPESKLGGAFTLASDPKFSWEGLLANSFQPALEKYVADGIGFRNLMVRSRNQLLFSIFGITRSTEIIVGKNEVLFMPSYIRSYLGHDSLSAEDIRFQVLRLRMLQHDLAQHGISFLFVMAPNKAHFEPENLPAHPARATRTNYDFFVRQMQADSVHLLDCIALFDRWKHTKPYPLYPRGGTHWSGYGATLVADSLMHRLEALGGYQLPSFREVGKPKIVYSIDSMRSTDNDLATTLNLLFRRETTPLAYRHIQFDPPRPGQIQPSLLLVSDSYCWGLMEFSPYIQREFAPDSRVWFYNKTVWVPDSVSHADGETAQLDLRQQLEKRRSVVLLMTDFNLVSHEFWFTEQVYQLYHPFTDADKAAIQALAATIRAADSRVVSDKTPEQITEQAYLKAQQQYEGQQMEKILAASHEAAPVSLSAAR